jgi:hypothetical protein
MTGLLNAAFAVGVPDCISHLSEEGMSETGEKEKKRCWHAFLASL